MHHICSTDDPIPFFVMDHFSGGDLRQFRKVLPQDLARVLRLVSDVADALDYIHGQNLVHNDVKPTNILLDASGCVFITDFGMVAAPTGIVASDLPGGTLSYMAPEAFEHFTGRPDTARQVDGHADVYSLGVVLYELLTGQAPFQATNRFALMYQRMRGEPPIPSKLRPNLPSTLDDVMLLALAAAVASGRLGKTLSYASSPLGRRRTRRCSPAGRSPWP